jgi:hypothetical protein
MGNDRFSEVTEELLELEEQKKKKGQKLPGILSLLGMLGGIGSPGAPSVDEVIQAEELRDSFDRVSKLFDARTEAANEKLKYLFDLRYKVNAVGGDRRALDEPIHYAIDQLLGQVCRQFAKLFDDQSKKHD